jgi:hypothetical protein
MKSLMLLSLLTLLIGCQGKLDHEVSGEATSTNVIRIEIVMPPETVDAFKNTCKSQCVDDTNPTLCETNCNAQQQVNYTNAILALISQFQTVTQPTN